MLWIEDAPECSGLSDGPLPNVLRASIDFQRSTNISPAMAELDMSSVKQPCTVRTPVATPCDKYFDAHVQSLARVAQVHECTAYWSDTKRRTACRFGSPQELQHESVVQTVFHNNKTKKVISTQRNHPRVNAHNPSILGCWQETWTFNVLWVPTAQPCIRRPTFANKRRTRILRERCTSCLKMLRVYRSSSKVGR